MALFLYFVIMQIDYLLDPYIILGAIICGSAVYISSQNTSDKRFSLSIFLVL